MTALPIRPRARLDETLAGYLARVAEDNLSTINQTGWPFSDHQLRHTQIDWEEIAAVTGRTTAELRALTPFRYPASIAGSGRPRERNTRWRATSLARFCPGCGRRSSWDLLLVVCCGSCRQLVRPGADTRTYPRIPEDDPFLSTQRAITSALERSRSEATRRRLNRLHRLVRLASLTADVSWPPTGSAYLSDLRSGSRTWEPWTPARPPADPVVAAVLVGAAWKALRDRTEDRAFVAVAWSRVRDRETALTRAQKASLPKVGRTQVAAQVLGAGGRAVADAARDLRRSGFTASNVPLMLTSTDEFLPPLHELRRRHHLALLLRRALGATDAERDHSQLRLGPHTTCDHEVTSSELRPYLEALLAQPRVDYNHARTALAIVPRSTLRATGVPEELWTLVGGWMWTQHTRGPLLRDAHRLRLIDLVAFHRSLDPEQRLHLDGLGQRLITWTDQLDQRTQTSGAGLGREAM